MANFQRAIEWLKSGGKVRRPSWKKDSYWILGVEESIQWVNGFHAHIHLDQIKATDWEIYEDKTTITVQEAIDQGLISRYCNCELCKNHPDNIHNKEKDEKPLGDKTQVINSFNFRGYKEEDTKECFRKIRGDFVRGELYNWVEIENIINKRVGSKLI